MSRSCVVLWGLAAVLPLAACGAGSSSSSSSSSRTSATTTATATATATAPAQTLTHTTSTSIPASNGAGTAVLPANFVVNPDGAVTPSVISGPLDTTIELIVSSRVSQTVTVAVGSRSITVPPHGRGTARVSGLKRGRYPLTVDGRARAALIVGVQPGP